jgi:hypothetical protein
LHHRENAGFVIKPTNQANHVKPHKPITNLKIKGKNIMTQIIETSTIIPSLVGVGKTDFGLLSVGSPRRATLDMPHVIQWNETQYLVGEHVEMYTVPTERMDFLRLADGPEARALTYATLAKLMPDRTQMTGSIEIGFPVEVMMDRTLATQILRDLRSWLIGTHQFMLDKKEYRITIDDVQAVAQPAGAFFSWGMNNMGKWIRKTDDLNAMVGICDIGFNTLDIFSVAGSHIIGKYTGGDTAGIRRAAEALMRAVKEKYDVALSRQQADRFLREKKPILNCWQGQLDILTLTNQSLDTTSAAIGDFIETLLGNGKQFSYLLFTGGGSEMIRSSLTRRYPHGQILPNPVMANARGLAYHARRTFKKAQTVIGLDPGFGGFKAVCLKNE